MKEEESEALLDGIDSARGVRELSAEDLPRLAKELREEIIRSVSETGGHLGASLGVVELTIALHYVFETPKDRIVWDVGHQAYGHKILTGRRGRMGTLRKKGGLSGFTRRAESEYDPFGAAHAGTAISAGLGMATARDLLGEGRAVACVVGDGAMSAGMAYEAMNDAGSRDARLVVILNDNDMSISPAVGAMSAYLARLTTGRAYRRLLELGKRAASALPSGLREGARRAEEYMRGMATGGTLFEELGFRYAGPLDGHDFDHLLPVLKNAREEGRGPVLVHVVTRKGKGYGPAEESRDKYHGVGKFDVATGKKASGGGGKSCTEVFGEALIREGERDEKVLAITAAMGGGSGVEKFGERFPERMFDVGIAEQHAVTFAAGLASEGMKPFAAIYATFLQRACDQVIHDVAIQGLPVRFAVDRAGLVGADGSTHAGLYDVGMLCGLPGFVVMGAGDEADLARMVATAAEYDEGPISFRYPRGALTGEEAGSRETLELGRGRVMREGTDVAVASFGGTLGAALEAARELEGEGLGVTVADMRFAKPLDEDLLRRLMKGHKALLLTEEGASGGFGLRALECLANGGLLEGKGKVRTICVPDRFIEQDEDLDRMRKEAGLSGGSFARALRALVAGKGG